MSRSSPHEQIPYAGLLIVLYASQRSILYQKPNVFAEPTINGGRLVRLTAGKTLKTLFERRSVSSSSFSPVFPTKVTRGTVSTISGRNVTVFQLPTIVYFHGNADQSGSNVERCQIGWGASYIGKVIHDLYGFGFYGVEYPGYGTSEGLKTCEESIYLSSVQTSFPIISFGLRLLPWLVRDKFDNLGKASKIDIPTVVLHGDEDEIVPYSQGAQLSKAIKGSRLVTIEGGGHNNLFGSRFEQQVERIV
ncbi:hypothetical protein GUITHDRAFT_139255 [Guillardia theta CCMP2712]|uniref:AB hydrolase-1 domain-containing protein n=1 Tax=Guillardia theta (strain CCMP2712) TaxID=905079 RepID=L1JA36_GUITC|nr:hypothetical protein GUITHDRAFT_139255 [Guillardia theta CCMP2712]EKX44964.1 hypothetical protein GUITHDRAFT_139255 [Guillardia theta CCMP2712]|eukprot:XP_005831944.1 hypothetical protein GUITHDRAFT_139255 [Guillardia theta CCMP2712]